MQENLNLETLQKQFQIVKQETNTSHVQEYGDMVCHTFVFIANKDKFQLKVKVINYKLIYQKLYTVSGKKVYRTDFDMVS